MRFNFELKGNLDTPTTEENKPTSHEHQRYGSNHQTSTASKSQTMPSPRGYSRVIYIYKQPRKP